MRHLAAVALGACLPISAMASVVPEEDGAVVAAILQDAFQEDGKTCLDPDFSQSRRPIDPYVRRDMWGDGQGDDGQDIAKAWQSAKPISTRTFSPIRLKAMFPNASITHDVAHCARAIHFDGPMRSGNWAFVVRHIVCAGLCGRGDALAYHFENGAWRRVVLRPLYAF